MEDVCEVNDNYGPSSAFRSIRLKWQWRWWGTYSWSLPWYDAMIRIPARHRLGWQRGDTITRSKNSSQPEFVPKEEHLRWLCVDVDIVRPLLMLLAQCRLVGEKKSNLHLIWDISEMVFLNGTLAACRIRSTMDGRTDSQSTTEDEWTKYV